MAKHRGQAQITIVDLNDAKQLVSYISSKLQRQTIFNPNSNVYLPNYSIESQVLTPQLFIAGKNEDIANKAIAARWYYQENSNGSPVPITGNTDTYELSDTMPTTLTIKRNIFEGVTSMNYIVELDYIDEDTSSALVTSAKSMIELTKITNGTDGKDGENVNTMILSNETHTISTNSDGSGGSYTNAATEVSVYNGNRDDTKNWSFTFSPSTGIKGAWDSKTYEYKVSEMTTDTGTVTITASKSGQADLTKVYSLSKAKQGLGKDAVSTWIIVDTNIIYQDNAGAYDRSSIEILGKAQVGTNPVGDYAGRFKIYESTDGSNFFEKYKSTSNESSKVYTFNSGIKAIKVEFYEAGGTTNLIDTQQVTVLVQPDDAISAYLDNEHITVPTNSDGTGGDFSNVTTKLIILRGITDVTDEVGWTYSAIPSSGISGELTGSSYSVSDMSTDSGFVDITVKRTHYSTITKRFTISKNKDGIDGLDAISYWGNISDQVIAKRVDGSLSPTSITITSSRQKGTQDIEEYAGRLKIFESIDDGKNWVLKYTSSTDETEKTYSLTDNTITNLKVEFYLSGAVTNKYDEITAQVVKDGKSGIDGQNAKLLYLSSSADVMKFNSSDVALDNQLISFTANLQNLSGTATFTATPYIGSTAQAVISLGGSGNTRTLSGSQWTKTWDRVVVTATLDKLSDTKTIVKLKDPKDGNKGDKGDDGDTSYFHRAWAWSADGKDRFTTVYPNENLLNNSLSLAIGSSAWRSWGGGTTTKRELVDIVDDKFQLFDKAMKISRGNENVQNGFALDNVKIKNNTKYCLSAWVKSTSGIANNVYVQKGEGVEEPYGGKLYAVDTNWTLITLNFTSSSSATKINVYFGFSNSGLGGEILVIAPKLEEGEHTTFTTSITENFQHAYPTYIGTLTDFTEDDSINPEDYTWSRFTADASVTGFLTNESVTLGATATGTVGDFSKAKGIFKVYDGLSDRTGLGVVYSKVKETGCTGSINASTGEYSVTAMSSDTATLEFRASYKEVLIDKIFVLSKSKTGQSGADGSDSYNAILSNDNVTIATDPSGDNGNYTNASTTMSVYKGITDDTKNWTISINKSTTITGSLSGYKYTVTNMTSDTGFVQLIMKKNDLTLVKEFTLTKNKRATDGQDSVSYWLITGNPVIKKDGEGKLTPNIMTFSASKQKGEQAVEDFAGYFTIDETLDNTNWENKYTSKTQEPTRLYVISRSTIKALRIRLYFDVERKSLLDEQIITVVEDGKNPLLTVLSTPEGSTVKNNDGLVVVQSETYHGSNKVEPDEISWYLSDSENDDGWKILYDHHRNYYKKDSKIEGLGGLTNIQKETTDTPNGFYMVGVQGNVGSARIKNVINSNGFWTISFWVRGSQNSPITFDLDICDLGSSKIRVNGAKDNAWEFVTHTVNVTNYSSTNNFVDFNNVSWAYFFIKDLKIEKGQQATKWSPAPEDNDAYLGNENLFSVNQWKNKPSLYNNGVPAMTMYLEPNSYYTASTNIPIEDTRRDVFFLINGGTCSSGVNGVHSGESRTILTDDTGIAQICMRDYSLSSEYWIKIEKGTNVTGYLPYYDETDKMIITPTKLIVPADKITNVLGVKSVVKYNSIVREATTSITDVSDPMQLQIIGSGAFKNGTGTNTYIARVYQAGIEIDSDGSKGTYKWTLRDTNNNQIGGWNRTGKQISLSANDFVSNATIVCEVEF